MPPTGQDYGAGPPFPGRTLGESDASLDSDLDLIPIPQQEDGPAAHPIPHEFQIPGSDPMSAPSQRHSPSLMNNHDQRQSYRERPQANPAETQVKFYLDALDATITQSQGEIDLGEIRRRLHMMVVGIDSLLARSLPSNMPPAPSPLPWDRPLSASQVKPESEDLKASKNSKCVKALYQCRLCSPRCIFATKATFKLHITVVHTSTLWRCYHETCGRKFSQRENLLEHLHQSHEKSGSTGNLIRDCRVTKFPASCGICHIGVNTFDEYFECMCAHCRLPPDSSSGEDGHGSLVSHPAPPDMVAPITGTWYEALFLGLEAREEAVSMQKFPFSYTQGVPVTPSIGPRSGLSFPDSAYGGSCFTDSAYAGHMHRDQEVPLHYNDGQTRAMLEGLLASHLLFGPDNDGNKAMESDEDDGESVYSETSSTSEPVKEDYIAVFAEDIAKITRPFQPNKEVLERIFEVLPLLLKTFALSLGDAKSSQIHRNVMVFLHKRRM